MPKRVDLRILRSMEPMEAPQPEEKAIVIYRTINRDGETFALDPISAGLLRETYGDAVRLSPRVFVAHATRADYEHVHGEIAPQIITLLTGLSEERLSALGGVVFRDATTERDLPLK